MARARPAKFSTAGDAMIAKTKSMEQLLVALSTGKSYSVQCAARAVVRASFNHLFYSGQVPLSGDGFAMSTLLVIYAEIA